MIRRAATGDAAAIRRVHEAAFGRPDEADLVEALAPEVSLVAVDDGGVVGHVLLTRAHVGERPILTLALLGVDPECQRRGIGSALTRAAVAAASETAFPVIVVRGLPAFFARLGFEPARRLRLRVPEGATPEAWRGHRLPAWEDGVLRGGVRLALSAPSRDA